MIIVFQEIGNRSERERLLVMQNTWFLYIIYIYIYYTVYRYMCLQYIQSSFVFYKNMLLSKSWRAVFVIWSWHHCDNRPDTLPRPTKLVHVWGEWCEMYLNLTNWSIIWEICDIHMALKTWCLIVIHISTANFGGIPHVQLTSKAALLRTWHGTLDGQRSGERPAWKTSPIFVREMRH